ncbi:DNA topoisomerase 1 [Camellia lanceoleosa]|uniref:DNA topoisomerase 1 n=1 Tax=Camellia lanceoleosa TaxID=1840588 RepID=A0ACC0FH81_9ERIC|nr:DNA topoisomerase 1 [Camellia lanceoleosa]
MIAGKMLLVTGSDRWKIVAGYSLNSGTVEEPKILGLYPGSNEKILLKNGPYGFYVQLGEDRKGYLPKRASVSQAAAPLFLPMFVTLVLLLKHFDSITPEDAIELLRYPVTLGNHPDDGQPVVLKLAKFGFFSIRHQCTIAPVPKNLKPNDITFEKALELLLVKDLVQQWLVQFCNDATTVGMLQLHRVKQESESERPLVVAIKVTPILYGNLVANTAAGIAGGTGVMPGEDFYNRVEKGSIKLKKAPSFSFCKEGILVDGDTEAVETDMVILATGFKGVEKLKDILVSPTF